MATINFQQVDGMKDIIITTNGENECMLWLNSSYWISLTSEITIVLKGEAYLHRGLRQALNWGFPAHDQINQLNFTQKNKFPSKDVFFQCEHNVRPNWSCQKKTEKCQMIIRALEEKVMINNLTLQTHYRYDIIRLRRIQFVCLASSQFRFLYEEREIACVGPDSKYELGLIQSWSFFRCVEEALEIFTIYQKETKACAGKYTGRNGTLYHYIIDEEIESLEKRTSVQRFPHHFLLRCSMRLPRIEVKLLDWKNILTCKRPTLRILKSYEKIETCWDFIDACFQVLDCIERQSPCKSPRFGEETANGFLATVYVSYNQLSASCSCDHWGVKVYSDLGKVVWCFQTNYEIINITKKVITQMSN